MNSVGMAFSSPPEIRRCSTGYSRLGLRVEDLCTLMGTGLYNEPKGAWLPSFTY